MVKCSIDFCKGRIMLKVACNGLCGTLFHGICVGIHENIEQFCFTWKSFWGLIALNLEILCFKLTIVSNIFIILCYIPTNLNPTNRDLYDSFLQHLYYIDNILKQLNQLFRKEQRQVNEYLSWWFCLVCQINTISNHLDWQLDHIFTYDQ